MNELIVTADDLGIRAAWDRAIMESVERGVVSSVSVVTCGASYDDARAALRACGVDVGVHLDLVTSRPLSPAHEIRSLVSTNGSFVARWWRVVARELRGALSIGEVTREWERQIERAFDDGLRPTHLNSHYHLHLMPRLFDATMALARRFGIRAVRAPAERASLRALRGAPKVATLGWLARRARRQEGDPALVPSIGIADSGRLGEREWTRLLTTLPSTLTEVSCHPGQSTYEDAALRSRALLDALRRDVRLVTFESRS